MKKIFQIFKVKSNGSFLGIQHFRVVIAIIICFVMIMEYSSWQKRIKFSDIQNLRITLAKCTKYNFQHMKYSYSGYYYVDGVKHSFSGFRTKSVKPEDFVDRYFWVKFHVNEPESCIPYDKGHYIILKDSIPIEPSGIKESEFRKLFASQHKKWGIFPILKNR